MLLKPSLHESLLSLELYQLTEVCPKGDTSGSELKTAKFAFTPGHFVAAVHTRGPKDAPSSAPSPGAVTGRGQLHHPRCRPPGGCLEPRRTPCS